MNFNKKVLFYLSLLTLFGFSLAGVVLIHFFQDETVVERLVGNSSWPRQLLWGSMFGINSVILAIWLIRGKWFSASNAYFANMIGQLKPTIWHILFYSFCAGVGEEVLFRGAIQAHLGIWLTSILFVLLHGYLNPANRALLLYGLLMVVVSSGLGYLFELHGLIAASLAHFLFDVGMFSYLKWEAKRLNG